jgi:hypothetical protein
MLDYEISLTALRAKYEGKRFRYKSKYGGFVDNLLCIDVSIIYDISKDTHTQTDEFVITRKKISLISDKNNIYELDNIEFYE